jgi:tRNA nucleotidyltransferase/poly(A) polymerase
MRDVLDDMKASNAERTYGLAMTQALTGLMDADVRPGMGEVARGRAAYRLGADVLAARLRLDEASGYGDADRDLDYLSKFERPRLPIKGKTLLGLGIPAGPKIGEVLDVLEEAWIDSQFSLDHDALLAKAKGMLS